jgi:hypothetical protein
MKNFFYVLKFLINNFKRYKNKKKNAKILIELFDYKASIISNGIFANVLKDINNAEIVCYEPRFLTLEKKIKNQIRRLNFFNYYNLYKSFGISSFVFPESNSKIFNLAKSYYEKFLKKIKTKKDITNFSLNGIYLGDILYDTYLREKAVSTINLESKEFKDYLFQFFELFFFWKNYFSKNNVKAIVISHSVYLTALMPRIAMSKNIDVFNCAFSSIYRLTKKKPLKFSYFDEYPKEFKKFPKKIKLEKIKFAKKYLHLRLGGKEDILYNQSKQITFPTFLYKSKLNLNKVSYKKDRKIILISAHDFTDAAHVHGNMLFADFYEWFDFLGKISNQIHKDYLWLVKLHPSDYDNNIQYVNYFINKYPKLVLLDKNKSHNELLKLGVSCVLTVYGSIGHEYPLFQVPVINAGNNPHKGYPFCYHPKSIKEYLLLLKLIPNLIVKKETIKFIYEFYVMQFLVDYNLFEEIRHDQSILNTNAIFEIFCKKFDSNRISEVNKIYEQFIKSKKRRLYNFSMATN